MPTYRASLSDGWSSNGGGETKIQADDMGRAWSAAVDWTKGGDYPETGCRILLRVTCAETGECREGHVTIDPIESKVSS